MNSSASSVITLDTVILPAETHFAILAGEEPAVGDGDTMDVAAEIVQHQLRPAKGGLGIDDPADFAQRREKVAKAVGCVKR